MLLQPNHDLHHAVSASINGWAVPDLRARDEIIQLLQQPGIANINCHGITTQTLTSADYMYKATKRLRPVQRISQWLGLRTPAQSANYRVGVAQHRLFTEYLIFTAQKPA